MKSTIITSILFFVILGMLVVPVPSWLIDLGLAASFAFSILIFTLALFVQRPLEFSVFPSILLTCLLLRLALNIASTKLILTNGHTGTDAAGDVIHSFASFVMSDNIFLGLIIFTIFLIVNFLVINKGASRMAEVGARFALDGMPGRQLAIDSDLSSGSISFEEAKLRREIEKDETAFFGALDGASKFIKGDAVAGLLITIMNLVVGLCFGIFTHNLTFLTALETYAILTVGDGLVSQIPAVIVSISAAIIISRSGLKGTTDTAVTEQFTRYPQVLLLVGGLMAIFALFPGLPFFPFFMGSLLLLAVGSFLASTALQKPNGDETPGDHIDDIVPVSVGDLLELDAFHIEFASDLVNLVMDEGSGLDTRIVNMRRFVATTFGIVMPEIRLTDNSNLSSGMYRVKIQGVTIDEGQIYPGCFLALKNDSAEEFPDGIDVHEPVYKAPARWIREGVSEEVGLNGTTLIAPVEVLATHVLEIVKKNLSRLLTLKSMRQLLDELENLQNDDLARANKRMLDEFIPDKVPLDCLHAVLRMLLDEQVSIRNLELIIEAIAEIRPISVRPEVICEHVRQRLGFQLVADLRQSDGTVPLLQLAPEWDDVFLTYQVEADRGLDVALPPDVFKRLSDNIERKLGDMDQSMMRTALVTNSRRRRFLKTVIRSKGLNLPVLSFEELGVDARPALVGLIDA